MSNLNQVLIEGNLVDDPKKSSDEKIGNCSFPVKNIRRYKEAGKLKEDVSVFVIEMFGELARDCSERLKKGSGVRIIGRLRQVTGEISDGFTRLGATLCFVVADHVVFKPEFNSGGEK